MSETIQPKTIHIERKRKINPALISRKFEYMSEEVGASAWMDIPEDADIEKLTAELTEYVKEQIAEQVEQITEHYRRLSRAQNVFYGELEPAFYQLMKEMGFDSDLFNSEEKFNRFKELLEAEMAKRSV